MGTVTLRDIASVIRNRRADTFLGQQAVKGTCPICGGEFIAWLTESGSVGFRCEKCQSDQLRERFLRLMGTQSVGQRLEGMRRTLISVSMKILSNREDAEEVVQDAFVAVIKRTPEEWGMNYVTQIVARRSIDRLRRKRSDVSLSSIPAESHVFAVDPEVEIHSDDMTELLEGACLEDRIVIEAIADSEDGLTETAQSLGVSEKAFKSALHRARRKLTGKQPCDTSDWPSLFEAS